MKILKVLGSQAPLVFVVLTAAFLFATGTLRLGPGEEGHTDAAARGTTDPHAGHDHGSDPEPAADPHAGRDHAAVEDPHAGCDHDEAEDPHAGHGHEEAEDPHAGHGHEEAEDPHAGHRHEGDWCAEHGVPEAECTRCDPGLIAEFKARGDWCAGHGVPESHCVPCGGGFTPPPEIALAALRQFRCEHGVPAIDCDGCRFEVGVVKVDPSVAGALLERGIVEVREAARTLSLTGQLQLDRTRVVDVPAPAGGRVLELACELGEEVEEGDLLAVLHSGEIAAAKAAWLEAATACEVAEREKERQTGVTAALDALLASLPEHIDRPLTGEEAEKPAEIPPGLVGEWKSKLLGAASRLRMARITHERERALEEKGISARSEHEVAHEAYEAAKAEYAALIEEVKLGLSLEKLRADTAAKQACAAMLAAEQRLRVYGLGEEVFARIREGATREDFSRFEIRAPRSGTITALDVSEGRYVEADGHLATIADLTHLWAWCDLYERDLAAVADRLAEDETVDAMLRVASFPGREFEGTLDLLGSEMDVHTRTVKARIQVANPGGRLRPGMFADVEVRLPGEGTVRVVPRTAVLSDDGDRFVFLHLTGDLWVRRDVEVRETFGDLAAVEGDLPAGATVATGGAFMLKGDILRDKMGAG
jgi:cobalt-zinc-cadmium efflux system membrane fusion protein